MRPGVAGRPGWGRLTRTEARIASSSSVWSGGRGVLGEDQVELAAVDVDPDDLDLDPVAQPVPAARAAADQGVRPLFQVKVVVAQARDVDQALGRAARRAGRRSRSPRRAMITAWNSLADRASPGRSGA